MVLDRVDGIGADLQCVCVDACNMYTHTHIHTHTHTRTHTAQHLLVSTLAQPIRAWPLGTNIQTAARSSQTTRCAVIVLFSVHTHTHASTHARTRARTHTGEQDDAIVGRIHGNRAPRWHQKISKVLHTIVNFYKVNMIGH